MICEQFQLFWFQCCFSLW